MMVDMQSDLVELSDLIAKYEKALSDFKSKKSLINVFRFFFFKVRSVTFGLRFRRKLRKRFSEKLREVVKSGAL